MAGIIQCYLHPKFFSFRVDDEPIVIGGRAGAIRVPGATVTRKHARIYADDDRCFVEDLGGDGVWVNGERVEHRELLNRDKIRVGVVELEYFTD